MNIQAVALSMALLRPLAKRWFRFNAGKRSLDYLRRSHACTEPVGAHRRHSRQPARAQERERGKTLKERGSGSSFCRPTVRI